MRFCVFGYEITAKKILTEEKTDQANLKDQIKNLLPEKDGVSIPALSKKIKRHEWLILEAIDELTRSGDAFVVGSKQLFREDGGSAVVILYTSKAPT